MSYDEALSLPVPLEGEETLFEPPEPTLPNSWARIGNVRRWRQQAPHDIRRTPKAMFAVLDREFGFTVDVAALSDNALCDRYFTPDLNGLAQPWAPERCWMNPPYSALDDWALKAATEAQLGALVVGLLPARTDLAWFHDNVLDVDAEVRFIRGRVRFDGMPYTAPFPSMIVVWRPA